ncbi:MAG: four helix bundle protein [Candidatus Staskawiczbacteria bacterium]|jgi:four helix bundle protein
MKIEKFEDIISWQKGIELSTVVYDIFKNNKDHGFRDQIQRAAVSISNNIAEGFERMSNKELSKFLFIAKGSAGEVRSMLCIALKLNYIDKKQFDDLYNKCLEISRLISGLIKTLQTC